MSFLIQGPYPGMATTLLLPSPSEGNSSGLVSSVQVLTSMNGKIYTYIKSKRGRRNQIWEFTTSKDKALETKEFVRLYSGGLVKTQDHNGVQRIGYILANPLDSSGGGRAVGWGKIEESVRFTLQFEESI